MGLEVSSGRQTPPGTLEAEDSVCDWWSRHIPGKSSYCYEAKWCGQYEELAVPNKAQFKVFQADLFKIGR